MSKASPQESCTGLRSAVGGGVDRSIRRGAKWLLKCVQDDFAFLSNKIALEHGAQVSSAIAPVTRNSRHYVAYTLTHSHLHTCYSYIRYLKVALLFV